MKKLNTLICAALLIGCSSLETDAVTDEDAKQKEEVEKSIDESDNLKDDAVADDKIVPQTDPEQDAETAALTQSIAEMIPSTRLTVKLSKDGHMEILDVAESRGRGKRSTATGEFVYYAAVDGKRIAAGAFEDPFVITSEHHPDDDLGDFIEVDEAEVVMDLPGVSLEHKGFDLHVERLSEDAHVRQMSLDRLDEMLHVGNAVSFAALNRTDVLRGLRAGRHIKDVRAVTADRAPVVTR